MDTGRPSDYTPEMGDKICQEIIDGRSLRSITSDEETPSIATVFKWLRERPAFLKQYELARSEQVETFADEMQDIADNGFNDYQEKIAKDGSTYIVLNAENIQRSRLRIDTRKWIAERMKPKKYGSKTEVEYSGALVVMPAIEVDGRALTYDVGDNDDTED